MVNSLLQCTHPLAAKQTQKYKEEKIPWQGGQDLQARHSGHRLSFFPVSRIYLGLGSFSERTNFPLCVAFLILSSRRVRRWTSSLTWRRSGRAQQAHPAVLQRHAINRSQIQQPPCSPRSRGKSGAAGTTRRTITSRPSALRKTHPLISPIRSVHSIFTLLLHRPSFFLIINNN